MAVLHAAEAGRRYANLSELSSIRMSELVILLLKTAPTPEEAEPKARLAKLGAHVRKIGCTRDTALMDYVRHVVRIALNKQIGEIDEQMERVAAVSPSWKKDLEQLRQSSLAVMETDDFWVPQEFLDLSIGEASLQMKRVLKLTGEMLISWPSFAATAKKLRSQGIRMATPIV
jgi:hypothetical protein